MDYVNAFWVGGLICALVQILMEKTKMMPGRIMVLLVVAHILLQRLHKIHIALLRSLIRPGSIVAIVMIPKNRQYSVRR